jgi:2-polyprenyl-3-methyl-5-hydroxy-6-metoxy-1,4-benzoquinol methylase
MAKRLRDKPGPPELGKNMHILKGHQRLDFLVSRSKPGRLLDVGCGEGAFSIAAKDMGDEVYAIDLFDVGGSLKEHGIHFTQTSLDDFNTDLEFNTILLMEVIEHLEDPEAAIEKCYGMLAYMGKLLITTPHVPDWDYEEDHIWRWTPDEFRTMIEKVDPIAEIWTDDIFNYAVLVDDYRRDYEPGKNRKGA